MTADPREGQACRFRVSLCALVVRIVVRYWLLVVGFKIRVIRAIRVEEIAFSDQLSAVSSFEPLRGPV